MTPTRDKDAADVLTLDMIRKAMDDCYKNTLTMYDVVNFYIEPRIANQMRQHAVGFRRARRFRKGPYYHNPRPLAEPWRNR